MRFYCLLPASTGTVGSTSPQALTVKPTASFKFMLVLLAFRSRSIHIPHSGQSYYRKLQILWGSCQTSPNRARFKQNYCGVEYTSCLPNTLIALCLLNWYEICCTIALINWKKIVIKLSWYLYCHYAMYKNYCYIKLFISKTRSVKHAQKAMM